MKDWFKKHAKTVRLALIAVFSAVAVASAAYLIWWGVDFVRHYMLQKDMENLANKVTDAPAAPPVAWDTPPPDVYGGDEDDEPSASPSAPEEPGEPTPAPLTERDVLAAAAAAGRERYADLLAVNADFLGFINIPELNIKEAFVKSADNEDYLTINFKGEKSSYGTVFMDCRNDELLTDRNTVLYGHYMNDGAMFAHLSAYKEIKGYLKSPVIELESLIGSTKWLVFAAYVSEPDYGYNDASLSKANFMPVVGEMRRRSYYDTDIEVTENDRILTLSTCSYEFEEARLVIHARRLRPGEEPPETFSAVLNKNRKPPVIPNQVKVKDISAKLIAPVLNPHSGGMFFYQRGETGIEWYSGSTSAAQGPYEFVTAKFGKNFSWPAGLIQDDGHRAFLAVSGLGGKTGINVMTAIRGDATFRDRGRVTPEGIDARWPLWAYDKEKKPWLYYVVTEADGSDAVYRVQFEGGTPPQSVMSGGSGVRPAYAGYLAGEEVFMWKEAYTGAVKIIKLSDPGNPVTIQSLSGTYDRLSVYGERDGGWRTCKEKGGKLEFLLFDPGEIKFASAPVIEEPVPEPEPVPESEVVAP